MGITGFSICVESKFLLTVLGFIDRLANIHIMIYNHILPAMTH